MIEVRVIDNQEDKTVLDVLADEEIIGKMLKVFYRKVKIPYPKVFENINEAKSFFYNFEKNRAKEYALFLLSRQSYHSTQLKAKLKSKLVSEVAMKKVIEELFHYLDDQGYIDTKIESEFKKGKGPLYIQSKLSLLGLFIDLQDIKSRISDKMQKERILSLIEKKFGAKEPQGRRGRSVEFDPNKVRLFLARKGFDYQLINEVVAKFHLKENQLENEL